MYGGAMQAN